MNVAVQKMIALPCRNGAAGTAVRVTVIPSFTQRVVLSFMRVCSGDEGDTLFCLLPVAEFRCAIAVGNTAVIDGFSSAYKDKTAIIRFEGGETLVTAIADVAGDTVTFADALKKSDRAVLYVMADAGDGAGAAFSVAKGVTELNAEGGFFAGTELGCPLMLELANADGKSVIEGGVAVLITA